MNPHQAGDNGIKGSHNTVKERGGRERRITDRDKKAEMKSLIAMCVRWQHSQQPFDNHKIK